MKNPSATPLEKVAAKLARPKRPPEKLSRKLRAMIADSTRFSDQRVVTMLRLARDLEALGL